MSSCAGEREDFPRIDTLMLAMPFSWKETLAQYYGRLYRNFEGKEDVRIYNYVDFRIPIFDRMYQNRLKGYKQLGYTIKSESCKENISQKIAIIDEKVLWYGNINFLGFTESEECAMRIVNPTIASEIEGETVNMAVKIKRP